MGTAGTGSPPWVPKNQVDSDKLEGLLTADGYSRADEVGEADLVVVNTCAFIDAARQESVDVVLELADARRPGARLVVTGCMAERYGDELRAALPEVDLVAGFGASLTAPQPVAVCIGTGPAVTPTVRAFDLLALPRPASDTPWAYVKVAEAVTGSAASAPSVVSWQAAVPAHGRRARRDPLLGGG